MPKLQEKPLALKENIKHFKHEICGLFSIFVGHFCSPGSGSSNLNYCGSGSEALRQNQCCAKGMIYSGSGNHFSGHTIFGSGSYHETRPIKYGNRQILSEHNSTGKGLRQDYPGETVEIRI
jgi:hypothetical protein